MLTPAVSPWFYDGMSVDRCGFDWAFPAQKPTAYLINAGLASTRHFITAFAKRAQPRLDWEGVGGVNVIVIESDYPIISSKPPELSHSLSLSVYLSSCFSSLSGFCLWVMAGSVLRRRLSFSLFLFVEVFVHRLSFGGSPAALGQLQPLSVSARLSASPGPILRLGQRGSGLRPHRPPPRVSRAHMCTQIHTIIDWKLGIDILRKTENVDIMCPLNSVLTSILMKVLQLDIRSSDSWFKQVSLQVL